MSKSNQVVCHIFLECALNKNLWMGVGRCWEETLEVRKRKRKEVNFHPCVWDKHGASHVTVTVELAQWSTFLWGKKKETPVSICHLMHNRDFVSYHCYFIFLHYPDPQDVTHTYIFLPIVYITQLCGSVRDPASYHHRWQWADWWSTNRPIIVSH